MYPRARNTAKTFIRDPEGNRIEAVTFVKKDA
jgi:hypothetical protein